MSRVSDPAWCAGRAPQFQLRSCSLAVTVVMLALLVQLPAYADTTPLSLDEAIERALAQAPQVAATSAMVQGAEAVAPSAGRLPDPELIAGVDNLPIDTADRFSFTRDFMTMRKIGVMQSFPNSRKRHLQGERAEREIAVSQAQLRKTRFDTALSAAEAWVAVALAEVSVERLRDLKPETELQAAAGRAALASGRATAAEALATQTLAAGLDEGILALEQDIEMRRAELAQWIGSAADRQLAPIPTDRELRPSPESLVARVSEHAPLAPTITQLAAAQTDVELARAERRPDWSVELSYADRGSDFSNMVSFAFRIGLPLLPRYRQNPVIAGKLAAVRAQEAERDAEIRMHTAELRAAIAEWRRGRERLRHYAAELLPLARDRSRAAVVSYGAGRGDLFNAIDSLTQEIDIQLDYVQLQGSVARAWVYLHLLHGSGAPQ